MTYTFTAGDQRLLRLTWPLRPNDYRDAVCAWLRAHGIDPMKVVGNGWILADDETRQIRYLAWATEPCPPGATATGTDRDGTPWRILVRPDHTGQLDGVREPVTVQLEARPMPFPPPPTEETPCPTTS